MKKKYIFIMSSVLAITTFQSCRKSNFDVNAPYAESAAIYGVLNPDSAVQVIRINKAFLGQGNAKQFAGIPDSINYGSELKAWILRIRPNGQIDSVKLTATTIQTANGGDFATTQKIYITGQQIFTDSKYSLYALNTKTKKVYTAITPLVGACTPAPPSGGGIILYGNTGPSNINTSFIPDKTAKRYDIIFRFNYIELVNGDSLRKHFDYSVSIDSLSLGSAGYVSTPVFKADIYLSALAQYVTKNADPGYNHSNTMNGKRFIKYNKKTGNIDILYMGSSGTLVNYINFNKPTYGLAQDKLDYTNISGGVGIFASRNVNSIANIPIDNDNSISHSYLTTDNPDTKNLDFEFIP